MAHQVPTDMPGILTAGDTATWTKAFPDYPPDTWTITYTFVNASAQEEFSGSNNGDGSHLIDVAPATTATWAAGDYRYQLTVTDGTDRYTLERGTVTIRTNFTAEAAGFDGRTTWQKILDQLEAAYVGMSAGEIKTATVSMSGRTVTYRSLDELIKAIGHAKSMVAQEMAADKLAEGLGSGRKVLVRF